VSKYRGYLTGSGNSVSRAGSETSGIHAKLSSITGRHVHVTMFTLPDGQEIVLVDIDTNKGSFPMGAWAFNKQDIPVPMEEV